MAWQSPKTNWATPDGVAAADMNRIEGNISHVHYSVGSYETASGTATAITLVNISLTNGSAKTFIVVASNGAAATTINGKLLYKPGTTIAPKLVAGKAITVWYSTTNDCFYIADDMGDALIPGTQGDIGDIIPTNADLLGGKDKGYFEALVDAVSQRVTENLTTISVVNNQVNELTNNLVEELVPISYASGIHGTCLKNKVTGKISLWLSIVTPQNNPTVVATLPAGLVPAGGATIRSLAKQSSGIGECQLSIQSGGLVVLSAVDYNEPMVGVIFNLFWAF